MNSKMNYRTDTYFQYINYLILNKTMNNMDITKSQF